MIWHFYAFFHLWLDSGDIIRFLVGRKQLNRAKSLLWFCLEHLLFVLGWLILPNFPTRTTTKRHDGIRPQHIVSHWEFSFKCQLHERYGHTLSTGIEKRIPRDESWMLCKRQSKESPGFLITLRRFLVIFSTTTLISFTKPRFWRWFWGAEKVWTSIGS